MLRLGGVGREWDAVVSNRAPNEVYLRCGR
jgi:hypothetical protein